jgi:hypothetical protein
MNGREIFGLGSLDHTALRHYGQTLERSVAIASVPGLFHSLKRLLNKDSNAVTSKTADAILAVMSGTLLVGGLHGTSWMKDLLVFATYEQICLGSFSSVFTNAWVKLYGGKGFTTKDTLMLFQTSALFTLAAGIVQWCLLNGKSMEMAIGLSLVPLLLQILSILFVTKEADIFGMDKNKLLGYIVATLVL